MIALLVLTQIVITSTAPPMPPAEAAAVLARLDSPSNRTNVFVCGDCTGPTAVVIRSSPASGPYGEFPRYSFSPLRCCGSYRLGPIHPRGWNGIDRYRSTTGAPDRSVNLRGSSLRDTRLTATVLPANGVRDPGITDLGAGRSSSRRNYISYSRSLGRTPSSRLEGRR